jgi:hypothetical protein
VEELDSEKLKVIVERIRVERFGRLDVFERMEDVLDGLRNGFYLALPSASNRTPKGQASPMGVSSFEP